MSNCNTICRLCKVNIKISGRSSINLFGEKSKKRKYFESFATVLEVNEIVVVDGLSDSLCQKCYREFIKFEKHLEQKGQLLAFREAYESSVARLSFNERKREKRCANESPKTVNHEKKKLNLVQLFTAYCYLYSNSQTLQKKSQCREYLSRLNMARIWRKMYKDRGKLLFLYLIIEPTISKTYLFSENRPSYICHYAV